MFFSFVAFLSKRQVKEKWSETFFLHICLKSKTSKNPRPILTPNLPQTKYQILWSGGEWSLPLVCNSYRLSVLSQWHSGRSLFSTDSTSYSFILHKRNSFSPRHQPNFLESFESAKDRVQALGIAGFRQLPQKQDLVGREVLVWYDRSS